MERRSLAIAAIAVSFACTASARAACPPPVIDHSYQTKDGHTVNVYRVPQGTDGESCTSAASEYVDKASGSNGNSAGTPSFDLVGTGTENLASCAVHVSDGTTMMMRGLPRITGGRFMFTNPQGQLVQLPLREVVSTDSGRRFKCKRCALDATGRPVADPAVKEAFARATPCPATGGLGAVCPGYVVDHVTPLACGGEDVVTNLQWQTEAEAKRKEDWRVKACGS